MLDSGTVPACRTVSDLCRVGGHWDTGGSKILAERWTEGVSAGERVFGSWSPGRPDLRKRTLSLVRDVSVDHGLPAWPDLRKREFSLVTGRLVLTCGYGSFRR